MGHDHHHEHVDVETLQRYPEIRKVTIVGALVNVVLAVAKIVVGVIGHSQALVADGIHSLSDLATDGLVLVSARHGSKEADEDHPYGHGRFETLATVVLGGLLMLVGLGICIDAYNRLVSEAPTETPHLLVVVIAALSVVSKEGLYHYTRAVAKKLRSNLLHANAWHHRTDSISSFIVIIGAVGAMAGWPRMDTVAAVVVALMVIRIGWQLGFHSILELVDTALHPERIAAIRDEILATDGVRELHMLRTRKMGGNALVDVHIIVEARLTVSEGHLIGEKVRQNLVQNVDEVTDVTVHIDPEDDEKTRPSAYLPPRDEVIGKLRGLWGSIPESAQVRDIRLHYLDGNIEVELALPITVAKDIESAKILSSRFSQLARELPEVHRIRVYYE